MASSINASLTAGLVQTADTSGILNLQSNGTTVASVSSTGVAVTGTLSGSSLTASQAVFTDASKGLVSVYPTAYVGGLTRVANAANSSVSYTGVGFKPSAISIIAETGAVFFGLGYTTPTSQRSVSMEAGVPAGGTQTDAFIYVTAGAATQYLKGSLTSMDADGFTISWTHSGLGASTVIVNFMAFR